MDRRDFLCGSALFSVGMLADRAETAERTPWTDLEDFVQEKAERDHIPGVAACIVRGGETVWSRTYGFADLDRRIPYSLDSIQNIGSVSKTFTGTAVMQVREADLIDLDDDVSRFLDFPVHNPAAPNVPITVRQLLTHTSSIADGPAYPRHYACGDPKISLATWVREYFTPGGHFHDPGKNFHPWSPGERWAYSNVGYGLLGHLVEAVSGTPFHQYCRLNIFVPLEMKDTAWYLADIDRSRHAVPYTWASGGKARGRTWDEVPIGIIRPDGPTLAQPLEDGYHANCLYNHPNFPDGFLRTSVNDLSRFMRAYLGGGMLEGRRVLRDDSVREMLTLRLVAPERMQGLTWNAAYRVDGELAWGHGGRDPGVNTDMRILASRGLGAIVFTNTNEIAPQEFTKRFLEAAIHL